MQILKVASATSTRYGLSRGLLGLKYDQINYSDSERKHKAVWKSSWRLEGRNDKMPQAVIRLSSNACFSNVLYYYGLNFTTNMKTVQISELCYANFAMTIKTSRICSPVLRKIKNGSKVKNATSFKQPQIKNSTNFKVPRMCNFIPTFFVPLSYFVLVCTLEKNHVFI